MRMGFIFSGVFWGLLLIILGLGVILKTFMNIDLPLFQLFLSFLLKTPNSRLQTVWPPSKPTSAWQ